MTISQLGSVLLGQSWAELFDLLEDKQGTSVCHFIKQIFRSWSKKKKYIHILHILLDVVEYLLSQSKQFLTRFSKSDWFLDVLKISIDAQQREVTFMGIV